MPYSDLVRQEGEYNYSANIQFDIENDHKLARFIPNETTVDLLREYFVDISRTKPAHHARMLYGSYGTGKSHFLTVLSLLLSKSFTKGVAFGTFLDRIKGYDPLLAADIESFITDTTRKPFLVVPIVFDFEDFDRCIYFSLKKKLEQIGRRISFKTFYDQALSLLEQWKQAPESKERLMAACAKVHVDLELLESQLQSLDKKSEARFQKIFAEMTFGVKYIYEVSNLEDSIDQANSALADEYGGIVFIFDEFGRYIEDNVKKIKVKSVQNLAEYCDHCEGNNHIILVSHKEISQYTQRLNRNVSNEWKKVEGRYQATPINDKQDQCLSLIRNILIKNPDIWKEFKTRHAAALNKLYTEAADFRGFLIDAAHGDNPFEGGFPLHPISLFALDKLSKKVAQNERTFFTYLASTDNNSLFRFLQKHELDTFHFVGIDEMYDYFVPNIKSLQSDSSYEWYKNLQGALSKNQSSEEDDTPEVRILKVIAVIGIINDAGTLTANKKTLLSVIDCPDDILSNAIDGLCERKIIKYSGSYDRYDFYEASIFDVESMIDEASRQIKNDSIVKTLNEEFIDFVLYPHRYNRTYKISRVLLPVYADYDNLSVNAITRQLDRYYDGVLVMVLGGAECDVQLVADSLCNLDRAIVVVNNEAQELKDAVKRYIAVRYLESKKSSYVSKDPTFEKELEYYKKEASSNVYQLLKAWRSTYDDGIQILLNGAVVQSVTSFAGLSDLASGLMEECYGSTLIVNNELLNKNTVSASIHTARKNAINGLLRGENAQEYYGVPYLSPDYIVVRSTLVKNGFIQIDGIIQNGLPDGRTPQDDVRAALNEFIEQAKEGEVGFDALYSRLKQPPFGLRDGYLALLLAHVLLPYKKMLIISSHHVEQELTAELFEEIVKRPSDYAFTIASWTDQQLDFMDAIEHIFKDFIRENMRSKNRLKAIYDGMLSHYRNVTKFSRTTQLYISEEAKAYRKLLEKSTSNYSAFLFEKLCSSYGSCDDAVIAVKRIKTELDGALTALEADLCGCICDLFGVSQTNSLTALFMNNYAQDWKAKRNKSFDYYTNAFLDLAGKVQQIDADHDLILRLSKALTGFELLYWNDSHKAEFLQRLSAIKAKLDAYVVSDVLGEKETRMTLKTANGEEKTVVFDQSGLGTLAKTVKNKINSTFNNYGLSISYDEKVQILLSVLEELMEGK